MRIENNWLGLTDYQEGLTHQQRAVEQLSAENPVIFIGCEHQTVITLGKRGVREVDVLQPERFPVVSIDRGGHATLHGPGQLVIYPIIDLGQLSMGIKEYVCLLTRVTREVLASLDIEAHDREGEPGLYTKNGKIAFFGIRVSKGISRHGISINVSNNLNDFSSILSCGHKNEPLDRVENYVSHLPTKELFSLWVREACKSLENTLS